MEKLDLTERSSTKKLKKLIDELSRMASFIDFENVDIHKEDRTNAIIINIKNFIIRKQDDGLLIFYYDSHIFAEISPQGAISFNENTIFNEFPQEGINFFEKIIIDKIREIENSENYSKKAEFKRPPEISLALSNNFYISEKIDRIYSNKNKIPEGFSMNLFVKNEESEQYREYITKISNRRDGKIVNMIINKGKIRFEGINNLTKQEIMIFLKEFFAE